MGFFKTQYEIYLFNYSIYTSAGRLASGKNYQWEEEKNLNFEKICAFKIVEILKILKFLPGSGLNQICNLAELISLNYLNIIKIEQFLMYS